MRIYLFFLFVTILFSCKNNSQKFWNNEIEESLNLAVQQYQMMDESVPDSLFPRSIKPDSTLWTNTSGWWTSGFFPGSLWYLYEFSGNDKIKDIALKRTKAVENEKNNYWDHDIGFKIYCSFGNGLRITGDTSFKSVIVTAAKTLSLRFNQTVGCIRSWGAIDDTTDYLVIIDNMMNLELLFNATRFTGDSSFYRIALAHADNTLKNHYREDNSCFHVLSYDQKTGDVIKKRTAQGYSDSSAWARGQAWGLYGFTMAYSETGLTRYLDQANKIAQFLLNHKNLPEDKIPYWDFDAPNIPNAFRDVSAAAIIASALIELSGFSEEPEKKFYLENAEKMIESMSSEQYRAKPGENKNFLLKHGVGNIPSNSEIDVPLSYADFYYIEAMMRYKAL